MLAAMKGGGAATPVGGSSGGGSMTAGAAQVGSRVTDAINSALTMKRVQNESKMLDADLALKSANVNLIEAQKNLANNNAKVAAKNAEILDAEMPAVKKHSKINETLAPVDATLRRVGETLGIFNSAKDAADFSGFGKKKGSKLPSGTRTID